MKVLIVSHNLISKTSNMGKTLLSYFHDFSHDEVAQFYIHSEEPVDGSVCRNYYRFTDVDALKSLFLWWNRGRQFGSEHICEDRVVARTDDGLLGAVYQSGRKRTAVTYVARNLLWKLGRWNNRQLWNWVEEFDPDVIFFASGDYGFMYDIARTMAERLNKPLVVTCVDDYYLQNKNSGSWLGRFQHRWFLKTVNKTMNRACSIFVICSTMKREYEKIFGKICHVLHTPAEKRSMPRTLSPSAIAYLGNLGYCRNEQLVKIGSALKKISGQCIDVYSAERNPETLKPLTEENGIHFHGAVSAECVAEIMNSSLAVIHTESFDEEIRKSVRFSVSTKIGDSLMNGPCLIAYGPAEVASIAYLRETESAWVITDPEELEPKLKEILENQSLRQQIVARARQTADRNHNLEQNSQNVRSWLEQACREWETHRR